MFTDIIWKCAWKLDRSPKSTNRSHEHSHSMNKWTIKADKWIDGCIMALKNNSVKYPFVSCYFILHYRHHIVFAHTTRYSHLLENDVIKQQNRKFAYFCIVWSSIVSQLFHLYCLIRSVLLSTEPLPPGFPFLCMGVFRELVDCILQWSPQYLRTLVLGRPYIKEEDEERWRESMWKSWDTVWPLTQPQKQNGHRRIMRCGSSGGIEWKQMQSFLFCLWW